MAMTPATPEQHPLYRRFASAPEALAYHAEHGGWLAIRADCAGAVWFDGDFTERDVRRHPAAKELVRLMCLASMLPSHSSEG